MAGALRYDRGEVLLSSTKTVYLSNEPVASQRVIEAHFYTDYAEAQTVAAQQEKPLLLFFTTQNCVFSKRMAETTFQLPVVRPLLEQFVLVKIDLDEYPTLWQEFKVESSPTIQFISSKGILLQRLNGETKPEQLTASLNSMLHALSARRTGTVLR